MLAIRRTAFLSVMLLAASLQAQSPLPPGTWRIADAPSELQYPISRAGLIVVSMQDAMLRELKEALELGGPEFAIKSCHIDVVGITRRISRQEGVTAGRTSDRLRSSANAPKTWAAPLVAAYAGRRSRDVEGFAVDLGDKVGVLRPIAEQPMCASCHGPAEKVSPAVREALGRQYPRDLATGSRRARSAGGSGSRCRRRGDESHRRNSLRHTALPLEPPPDAPVPGIDRLAEH
jgi:hypothetical protein